MIQLILDKLLMVTLVLILWDVICLFVVVSVNTSGVVFRALNFRLARTTVGTIWVNAFIYSLATTKIWIILIIMVLFYFPLLIYGSSDVIT